MYFTDTVTQLFSNLLKNSESSTNLQCKSPSSAPILNNNLSQSMSQECSTEKNDRSDFISEDKTRDSSQRSRQPGASEASKWVAIRVKSKRRYL